MLSNSLFPADVREPRGAFDAWQFKLLFITTSYAHKLAHWAVRGSTGNEFCNKNGQLWHFSLFFDPPEKLPDAKIGGVRGFCPETP